MRILHLIRGMANSSGTTHIVGPLAEAQARLGHEVRLLTVEMAGEQAVLPNAALVRSEAHPMTFKTRHFGYSRSFARALNEALNCAEVAHVHAIWNYVTWRGMRAAARAGVPYMVAPQGSLESWALGRSRHTKALYARWVEKPLFDQAAAMQALTAAERAQCERYRIQAPVRILPNGVDLEAIDRIEGREDLVSRYGLPAGSRILLFLSRIFPKKGLDVLLRGFAAARLERVHLLVAGHDSGTGYRGVMEALAAKLGLGARVHFIGELRGEEKFRVLRGADAFALTSHSEGLPVAVVEAMACALPIVITPGCNLPEVAQRAAGWVIDPEPPAVAAAITEIFADIAAARARGVKARGLVEERFTWPKIAAESVRIYASLKHNG